MIRFLAVLATALSLFVGIIPAGAQGLSGGPATATIKAALGLPGSYPIVGCGFGESFIANGHFPGGDTTTTPANATVGSQDYKPTKGWQFYAEMATGFRVEFPRQTNQGIFGQDTNAMAGRADAAAQVCKGLGGSIAVLSGGSVDSSSVPNPAISVAQTQANYVTMERAYTSRGIVVIWFTPPPRGCAATTGNRLTAAQNLDQNARRRFLMARANNTTVYTIDSALYLADNSASATAGDILATATYDCLHANARGSYFYGQQIANVINRIVPARDWLPSTNADVWSATNTGGAVNTNALMVGTTGTLGSGVTGTMPASWGTGALPAGMTIAASKTTDLNGRNVVAFAVSGTPTGTFPNIDLLRQDLTVGTQAGLVVGGTYIFCAEYEWDAAPTGVWSIDAFLTVGSIRYGTGTEQSDAANSVMPSQAVSGISCTPRATIPAGTTATRSGVRFYGVQNVAPSTTVRVKRVALMRLSALLANDNVLVALRSDLMAA